MSKPFKNNVLTVNLVILTIINYNEFSQKLPIKWVPLLLFLEQFLFEKNKTTEVLLINGSGLFTFFKLNQDEFGDNFW